MKILSAKLPRIVFLSSSFALYAMGMQLICEAEKNQNDLQRALDKLKLSPQLAVERKLRLEMFGVLERRAPALSEVDRWKLSGTVVKYSQENGHDPYLLLAVIETESAYKSDAVSNMGAVGYMQVRPFVARSIADELDPAAAAGMEDLTDMETNLRLGSYYLSKMKGKFKNLDIALIAYNQGPTKISASLRQGKELDMRYSRKVLNSLESILKEVSPFKRAA